jgi:hypothetical protein
MKAGESPDGLLMRTPENRVYVSVDRAEAFIRSFLAFSHGRVISDNPNGPSVEIGRPADTYRRILISSLFGKLTVLVTDGHLPYPYGRETTGYEVANLTDTLTKAKAAGSQFSSGLTRPTGEARPWCNSRVAV